MGQRYVSIWFRYLAADYSVLKQPALANQAFVLAAPDHGRMVVRSVNAPAQAAGIEPGCKLADARAIVPGLEVLDEQPGIIQPLLERLAAWCLRFTPVAGIDLPDGLLLDVSGCAHLWGGEASYLQDIVNKLSRLGFTLHVALADTPGAAWALARYAPGPVIQECGTLLSHLLPLPPEAFRIDPAVSVRLHQLGLRRLQDLIRMPRPVLQRRFGAAFLHRLDQVLGHAAEAIVPVQPPAPYSERLPCLEPIVTATGIAMALDTLLTQLCIRLTKEGKGLRQATLKGFRVDGRIETISIGTNRASQHVAHLFHLFELQIDRIEPALGIELFVLEAGAVEPLAPVQEKLWEGSGGLGDTGLSELVDRLSTRIPLRRIQRYVPVEQYWPEWSFQPAANLYTPTTTLWPAQPQRPVHLLPTPAPIQVAAPIPDYPPLLFRYQGKVYNIKKADGPERIEQPWWLQTGQHRDYYVVEDEAGKRYWVFRSGHYDEQDKNQWFLHGFFA